MHISVWLLWKSAWSELEILIVKSNSNIKTYINKKTNRYKLFLLFDWFVDLCSMGFFVAWYGKYLMFHPSLQNIVIREGNLSTKNMSMGNGSTKDFNQLKCLATSCMSHINTLYQTGTSSNFNINCFTVHSMWKWSLWLGPPAHIIKMVADVLVPKRLHQISMVVADSPLPSQGDNALKCYTWKI